LGGTAFGLRAKARNFDDEGLKNAVAYAHGKNVKVYVTANIMAHGTDFDGMAEYFAFLADIGVDGLIVADLGVFGVAVSAAPSIPIHISTQASVTNAKAALMWREMGASRVILARELSLQEIKKISDETRGSGLELEVFAHGAMCMAYSGRCLISNYMAGRDANRGECAHACRWKYRVVEEQRPNEYLPVAEDGRGSFVFSSRDLRMVGHLDKLADAGVHAVKIEGRMKSAYYAASVTKAYRMALDGLAGGVYYDNIDAYLEETEKSNHRGYCTGFYFGQPGEVGGEEPYINDWVFLGVVMGYDADTQMAVIEQRNRFSTGEAVEVLVKRGENFTQTIAAIYDSGGEVTETADRVQEHVRVKVLRPVSRNDILRRRVAR
jgi:putative protease